MGMSMASGENAPGASWVRRRALASTAAAAMLLSAGAAMAPSAQAAPSGPTKAYVVRADAGHLSGVVKALHHRHLTVTRTLRIIDAVVVRATAGSAAQVAHLPHVAEVTPGRLGLHAERQL